MSIFRRKSKKKKPNIKLQNKPSIKLVTSLNYTTLAKQLSKEFNLSQSESERILSFFQDQIKTAVKANKRVRLRNFGSFELRKSRGKLRPKFNPSKNFIK